jgi:hypothetical protein
MRMTAFHTALWTHAYWKNSKCGPIWLRYCTVAPLTWAIFHGRSDWHHSYCYRMSEMKQLLVGLRLAIDGAILSLKKKTIQLRYVKYNFSFVIINWKNQTSSRRRSNFSLLSCEYRLHQCDLSDLDAMRTRHRHCLLPTAIKHTPVALTTVQTLLATTTITVILSYRTDRMLNTMVITTTTQGSVTKELAIGEVAHRGTISILSEGSIGVVCKENEVTVNPSQCRTTVVRSLTSLAGQLSIISLQFALLCCYELFDPERDCLNLWCVMCS